MAAAPTHNAAHLTAGPELEIAADPSAIIRWTISCGYVRFKWGLLHALESRDTAISATPSKKPPALEVPLLIADLQVNVIDYLFYPGNFSADTPERK
jgi:hypothetical protein